MRSKREHWSSTIGFFLAVAGSAIGLGTMWKLPYTMGQNGGGAFILVYLAFTFLIGIPLFIAELLLGRKSQRGVVGTFSHWSRKGTSWNAIGWLGITVTLLIAGWYAVIAGWGLNYIFLSLADTFAGKSTDEVKTIFETFRQSGDLNVFWQVAFVALAASIVYRGLSKGIEHWSRILTSTLFVLILLLSLYSSTLDGFTQAIHYVLYPDFSELTTAGLLTALGLALFALSLGQGIMVTYGSYMSKDDDIPKTALLVGISIIFISVLIAIMIFPMVFTFGFEPQSGEGLIFITLPYVFEQLPGSLILSVLFFVLLVFAALTSYVGQMEVLVANLMDSKQWSRKKAVVASAFACILFGLPTALQNSQWRIFESWPQIFGQSFLDTNYILIDWMLATFGLFTAIMLGYFADKHLRDESFLSGTSLKKLLPVWVFLIRYVVPISILLIMLNRAGLLVL